MKAISTPQFNAFTMIAFNMKMAPFDNKKVRQAIAAALPYDAIFKAALFERGAKLYGGTWTDKPTDASFPQPMPYKQDVEKAKKLMAEAGLPMASTRSSPSTWAPPPSPSRSPRW